MNFNDIKFIHGIVGKPHSQGVCEHVLRTIKTGLKVKKLEHKNNFNIQLEIEEIIKVYNNTLHNVTKYTPNEVFLVVIINF